MRGALKIAKIFDIPVYVHWSFGLLFLFVAYTGDTLNGILFQSLYVLILFVCVVMHEFGHALSAKKYGITTQDIIILPIGGVARLNKMPEKPWQEFVVAIAGPMVNVVIALILGAGLYFVQWRMDSYDDITTQFSISYRMLYTIVYSNVFLVVFNMIPAFPMDGGRVLRALLSLRLGRTRATRIAATLGQIFAVLFIIFSLLPLLHQAISPFSPWGERIAFIDWEVQPVLALISFFIFNTAKSEYKNVALEERLTQEVVAHILQTQYTSLQTSDSMHKAAQIKTAGTETNFLVFDDAQILRGVLQEEDIDDAIKNNHHDGFVFAYTTHEFVSTSPTDSVKEAYHTMLQTGQYILPVFQEGKLEGVVDMAHIQRFMKGK
jgi:Zn-dependent protease/CBS domain-containing protein